MAHRNGTGRPATPGTRRMRDLGTAVSRSVRQANGPAQRKYRIHLIEASAFPPYGTMGDGPKKIPASQPMSSAALQGCALACGRAERQPSASISTRSRTPRLLAAGAHAGSTSRPAALAAIDQPANADAPTRLNLLGAGGPARRERFRSTGVKDLRGREQFIAAEVTASAGHHRWHLAGDGRERRPSSRRPRSRARPAPRECPGRGAGRGRTERASAAAPTRQWIRAAPDWPARGWVYETDTTLGAPAPMCRRWRRLETFGLSA